MTCAEIITADPPDIRVGVTSPEAHAAIDALERAMLGREPIECPVKHTFTPGGYTREIFMPAGAIVTSKIHRTEHTFVVSKGLCLVWIDGTGWVKIEGHYSGVTKPGTRRVLLILEDTIWTTFHPATETTVEAIEARIIEPHIPGQFTLPPMPTADEIRGLLEQGVQPCHG